MSRSLRGAVGSIRCHERSGTGKCVSCDGAGLIFVAEGMMGVTDSESLTPAFAPSTIGSFRSVHPVETVMEIMRVGVRGELSSPGADVGTPGVLASVYLSELTDCRLVVTAGNVLEDYFSFVVELEADGMGTRGRAYYDRPMGEIKRWYKNAMGLASGVKSVLVSASAAIADWDLRGSPVVLAVPESKDDADFDAPGSSNGEFVDDPDALEAAQVAVNQLPRRMDSVIVGPAISPAEPEVSSVACPKCGKPTSAELFNCEWCGAPIMW
jgi:hypothetical protein